MWLLSTDRAELRSFPSPDNIGDEYAILSHVWDGQEMSFQDLRALHDDYRTTGRVPRDYVSPKIRHSCLLAQQHGYNWIWIDACCIDKTSSAELSEAINSMFRFYALAHACYVFLRDVPSNCILSDKDSAFRKSRWHERGWTLQELLAPKLVIFISSDWNVIGTKSELAYLLEEVTRIPVSVLRFEEDLSDVDIARRMSWAGTRKTTRLEDEAYCLMGIFGVNMPTLYGEGSKAFYRLQEEIMRTSGDASIFAWGIRRDFNFASEHSYKFNPHHKHLRETSYLLAFSPSLFSDSNDIGFTPGLDDELLEEVSRFS